MSHSFICKGVEVKLYALTMQESVRRIIQNAPILMLQKTIFWGGASPLPIPHPLGAFGASILAPSALVTVSGNFCLTTWQP
jgi:hypothetical protein